MVHHMGRKENTYEHEEENIVQGLVLVVPRVVCVLPWKTGAGVGASCASRGAPSW